MVCGRLLDVILRRGRFGSSISATSDFHFNGLHFHELVEPKIVSTFKIRVRNTVIWKRKDLTIVFEYGRRIFFYFSFGLFFLITLGYHLFFYFAWWQILLDNLKNCKDNKANCNNYEQNPKFLLIFPNIGNISLLI